VHIACQLLPVVLEYAGKGEHTMESADFLFFSPQVNCQLAINIRN